MTTIDAVSFHLLCDNNILLRDTLIQCVRSKSNRTSPTLTPKPIRPTEHIRHDCARKLRPIRKSGTFTAILGSLLDEDWTTPNIEGLRITRDHLLVGRTSGQAIFKAFRCAEAGLIRNIHGIAAVAGLDGDELSYLLGKVEKIKTVT